MPLMHQDGKHRLSVYPNAAHLLSDTIEKKEEKTARENRKVCAVMFYLHDFLSPSDR